MTVKDIFGQIFQQHEEMDALLIMAGLWLFKGYATVEKQLQETGKKLDSIERQKNQLLS